MYGVKLENPYDMTKTVSKLRFVLKKTNRSDSLELLEKAISKSEQDPAYLDLMKDALLKGSTVKLREILSCFGDYFAPPRAEFPPYPFSDAVNGIDSVMHAIKFDHVKPGALQDYIDWHGNN